LHCRGAEGKVVKAISRLLLSLPPGHEYRVIFMQRPLLEVLASQDQMILRRGTYKEGANPAAMAAAFEKHLREVDAWMGSKPNVKSIRVGYHSALREPERISTEIAGFLGVRLNVEAMIPQVDASLYRNRRVT
jgi:hypothetical protein